MTPEHPERLDAATRGLTFFTLAEASSDALVLVNAEGSILWVNDAFCTAFGGDTATPVGDDLTSTLAPAASVEAIRSLVDSLQPGSRSDVIGKSLNLRTDATSESDRVFEVAAVSTDCDASPITMLTLRDVTDASRTRVALAESEERYRTLIETLRDGFGMLDTDGRFTFANDSLGEMIGYRPEEIVGCMASDFLTDAGAKALVKELRQRRLGGIEPYELEWRHIDGTTVETIVSPRPLTRDGENIGSFATVTDISALKEAQRSLEESERFIQTVLDTTPGIVSILEVGTRRTVFVNDAVTSVLGWAPEDVDAMGGDLFTELLDANDVEAVTRHHQALAAARDDEVLRIEFRLRSASGARRVLRSTDRVFRRADDGTVIEVVGVAMDVTDEVRVKADLERSNRELEQFASIASHDLQEPLRMVASYVQLLERRYGDTLGEEARDFIGFAVDGATRMKAMINGLLDYSRAATCSNGFSAVDLQVVVDEVLRDHRLTIEDAGATVVVEVLPTVHADRHQLPRVFANLLNNALKFRSARAPEIRVAAKKLNGVWAISVADNGIGIPERYHERVFDIFRRLSTPDVYPGTGIGLAIVRRIVDSHGGRLWLESAEGVGTTVFFTLPDAFRE